MPSPPLWAPWRIDYIEGPKDGHCFLCAAAAGPSLETLTLHTTETALVVLNRYPYAPGHVMVGPRAHVAGLVELDEPTHEEVGRLLRRTIAALGSTMSPEGFNVGLNLGVAAGAGVPGHLHWHVVPRWSGDTNFMPILGDVRVVPEHLEATWRRLRATFAEEEENR